MKNILTKIVDILYELPQMSRQRMQGIMNPLKTERQALIMLNYLQKNKNNEELMKIDNLMKKVMEMRSEN